MINEQIDLQNEGESIVDGLKSQAEEIKAEINRIQKETDRLAGMWLPSDTYEKLLVMQSKRIEDRQAELKNFEDLIASFPDKV